MTYIQTYLNTIPINYTTNMKKINEFGLCKEGTCKICECLKKPLDSWRNLSCFNDKFMHERILKLHACHFYPPANLIFNAFTFFDCLQTKVIIIGQDPYIQEGQATGLAFSIHNKKLPSSLINIIKEITRTIKGVNPSTLHGNLDHWSEQGVLLLNTILTVKPGEPLSHSMNKSNLNWEKFTKNIFDYLNRKCKNLVIMCWGEYARRFSTSFNKNNHLLLYSGHPSVKNVTTPFIGNNHFVLCNKYLKNHGKVAINW